MLSALRREVSRRVALGVEDAGSNVATLTSALEDDPDTRAVLEDAAVGRRRQDAAFGADHGESARRLRMDRESEAHAATARLVLTGELVPDGNDRVVLPGYGTGTWRAYEALRSSAHTGRLWAEAVAAGPANDLGSARPSFLAGLVVDPRLGQLAARLHLVQAARQDLRHALVVQELAIGAALDADNERGVRELSAESEARIRQLEHLDLELERIWREGSAAAVGYAPPP